MKKLLPLIMTGTLALLTSQASLAQSGDSSIQNPPPPPDGDSSSSSGGMGGGPGGGHRQPPAEAFTACQGKTEGATVSMKTPDGRTMSATCVKMGDRLAARPAGMPPRQ